MQGFCTEQNYTCTVKTLLDAYSSVSIRIVKSLQPKNKLIIFKKCNFMKNLQSFGVKELSVKEVNELNGGSWKWVYRVASAIYEAISYSARPDNVERFYGNNADNPNSKY